KGGGGGMDSAYDVLIVGARTGLENTTMVGLLFQRVRRPRAERDRQLVDGALQQAGERPPRDGQVVGGVYARAGRRACRASRANAFSEVVLPTPPGPVTFRIVGSSVDCASQVRECPSSADRPWP